MTQSPTKREIIIEHLADAFLQNGLGHTGLRGLGALAGTSDRMLIYYFGNKEALIKEVLEYISEQIASRLGQHIGDFPLDDSTLLDRMVAFGTSKDFKPYIQLWLEIVALAIRGEEPFTGVTRHLNHVWLGWIKDKLNRDQQHLSQTVYTSLQGILLYRLSQGEQ